MNHRQGIGILTVLAAAAVAPACRTRLLVSDISDVAYNPVIDGIPFRVRETHTVRVFQWLGPTTRQTTKDGKPGPVEVVKPPHFVQVMRQEIPFPNQRRLFALNFRSEQFADRDFKLHYFPDNTIRDVELSGTPKAEGAKALLDAGTGAAKAGLEAEANIAARVKLLQDAEKQRRVDEGARVSDVLAYLEQRDALRRHCDAWRQWEEDPATQSLPREEYDKQRKEKFGDAYEAKARSMLKDAIVAAAKIDRSLFAGDPFGLGLSQICAVIHATGGS